MGRILVIDDEEAVRGILEALIQANGHVPISVDGAQSGLDAVHAGKIDLAFCDVVMPDMDGLEFLERARLSDPDLPVVLMTAYADKKKLTKAIRLNAFDFVEKPFNLATIEVAMARGLAQRSMLAQQRRTRELGRRIDRLLHGLSSSRDLDTLYEAVGANVPQALGVDEIAVFARLGDTLECRTGSGKSPWADAEWSTSVRHCLAEGELVEVSQRAECMGGEMASGCGFCIPLQIEMQRWGMLSLFRTDGDMDEIDRRYFRLVADHLASSIAVRERSADLERALRALGEAQGRLLRTEKLASVTKLVAGLAHEIKNPLTSMQFAVVNAREELNDLEPDTTKSATLGHFLDIFSSDVERLRERVDRFMELARPDAAARAHVDVRPILLHVIDSAMHRANANDIELELDVPDELPDLEIDPVAFESAILNLVVNAIEAIEEGGVVEVSVGVEPDALVFTVADNGPGLSIEARERMFDIFFTTKAKGAGLGLSQVHVFVETHGGNVSCESNKAGTTFRVRLPRRVETRLI